MSALTAIKAIEYLAIVLAVVGECASLYGLYDALHNLLAVPRRLREAGVVTLTLISSLSVFVGVVGHGLLGFIALLSLGGNPPPSRYGAALVESVAFVLVQVAMVAASVLVPVLAARLRGQRARSAFETASEAEAAPEPPPLPELTPIDAHLEAIEQAQAKAAIELEAIRVQVTLMRFAQGRGR